MVNEHCASPKKLLALKNAATLLDMPVKTLRNLINEGVIPHLQPVPYGKIYLIPSDLDAWIVRERKGGTV